MSLSGLTSAEPPLKPVRHAPAIDALRTVLIVVVFAVAIRTFFLQPASIRTASMQPTLFGRTIEELRDRPDPIAPSGLKRLWLRWGRGVQYRELLPEDKSDVAARIGITAGDHVLVDRLTYNFRRPARGQIVVFTTFGLRTREPDLPEIPPDEIYTKRLIGLPGEHIRIGDDRHVIIDGQRLEQTAPHFRAIYSFDPGEPPRPGRYCGHLNARIAAPYLGLAQPNPAPRFPDGRAELIVRPAHVLVMGDNSLESLDGRAWGDFPESQVLGRVVCVYWPLNARWLRATR